MLFEGLVLLRGPCGVVVNCGWLGFWSLPVIFWLLQIFLGTMVFALVSGKGSYGWLWVKPHTSDYGILQNKLLTWCHVFKNPVLTTSRYPNEMQSFVLAFGFPQRMSSIWTCALQPNKERLQRLGFFPYIASKGPCYTLVRGCWCLILYERCYGGCVLPILLPKVVIDH